jgi:hypothetical protein
VLVGSAPETASSPQRRRAIFGGWDAMHTEMNAEIDKQEATAKAAQSIKANQPRPKR